MALRRTLAFKDALYLVIGNVVGAGIFTTSGIVAQHAGHPALFLAVWLCGGVLSLFGAFAYAELGAMFPRAGGDYQYLKEAFGPIAGFLLGWVSFWVITPGSIAALSIAFVHYLPTSLESTALQKTLALAMVAVVSAVNYLGVRQASRLQNAVTVGSVTLLVVLVCIGFGWGDGDSSRLVDAPASGSWAFSGAAMVAVIFTYGGWFASAYVGSEIVAPERTIPRSLTLGVAAVTVLYLGVNAVYLYAIPLDEMRSVVEVGALATSRLFGETAATFFAVGVALAILSSTNATVMTGARIAYAMAKDRLFFAGIGKSHPRFHTPYAAIVAQGLVAGVLIVLGTFEQLLSYVAMAMLLSSTLVVVGLFILRLKRPDAPRPYRAFGYPLTPALFLAGYLVIIAAVAAARPFESLMSGLLVLSGVPVYLLWRRKQGG